jgi:hypothetical protein
VRLATAVPITPGGLGLVEVGLTAALVLIAGEAAEIESAVVAAVLLFRALTFLLQVILGVICYMAWRWEARRQKAKLQPLSARRRAGGRGRTTREPHARVCPGRRRLTGRVR